MMLQTLVENAIKHGISKQMKGGVIKIVSDVKQNRHELLVQNTGHLNGFVKQGGGFGLSSTKDRLHILYGGSASFEIKQVNDTLVEAKVLIPIGEEEQMNRRTKSRATEEGRKSEYRTDEHGISNVEGNK